MRWKRDYSRGVDETLWTNVDKEIIEEGGSQTTTNRAQDRGPEPILMKVGENCSRKDVSETVTKRLKMHERYCTFTSITNHRGHDAGSQVTRGINSKS